MLAGGEFGRLDDGLEVELGTLDGFGGRKDGSREWYWEERWEGLVRAISGSLAGDNDIERYEPAALSRGSRDQFQVSAAPFSMLASAEATRHVGSHAAPGR
jgi:hypothetical protein